MEPNKQNNEPCVTDELSAELDTAFDNAFTGEERPIMTREERELKDAAFDPRPDYGRGKADP